MGGETFNLEDNNRILTITSPREHVGGPYVVVYKNLQERWAIVALDWDEKPRLGIRWFWGNDGQPRAVVHPSWLIVPPSLSKNILSGLPIDHISSRKIDDFLAGIINGADLSRHFATSA
jgi:hypothetical protein